jgi:hypothetical protein
MRATSLSIALLSMAGACTPDVVRDPIPEEMEFNPEAVPPRVPEPTSLIINPTTGLLDFSLAGTAVPADCGVVPETARAQCEFYRYLQTLDGYPTVSPARTPTTASGLDPATLTLVPDSDGDSNIVIVEAGRGFTQSSARVAVGFDAVNRYLTIAPRPSWGVGKFYWIAVRGYANGVRGLSATGEERMVVGSPTQALLKQETSLTCGATRAEDVDPHCPPVALLGQGRTEAAAAAAALQLESIRAGYAMAGAWDDVAAAGLPKAEVAVLWGFPVHTASVAELDPKAGLVPRVTAPDEIRVAVQGPVDPVTVSAFVVSVQAGSVVTMDLTALQDNNTVGGFPVTDATFTDGAIVIKGRQPFVVGHQYGIFLKRAIRNPSGSPLVPSPVSVLLTARGVLVDGQGKSTVSAVSDADAAMLEEGRLQLAALFDEPIIGALTGIVREQLVYCFAFPFQVTP